MDADRLNENELFVQLNAAEAILLDIVNYDPISSEEDRVFGLVHYYCDFCGAENKDPNKVMHSPECLYARALRYRRIYGLT